MKISDVHYAEPPHKEFEDYADKLSRYSSLAAELQQADAGAEIVERVREELRSAMDRFDRLVRGAGPSADEPDDLEAIRALRPAGVRRMTDRVPTDYRERWRGSFLGRGAGCTLGATVEFWSVEQMENWSRQFGEAYPPTDFFQYTRSPGQPRYIVGNHSDLTRGSMAYIPVDDDTVYTLIGLLTLENFGPGFTHEQQAALWQRNFTLTSPTNGSWGAYWGERTMLLNLAEGVPAEQAGTLRNPNIQSIAAWTRADAWGYAAPGWPEKAAELAYRDSSINHRRNGVYGTMYMAASVAAAFCVDDPVEALRIGLQEIPETSLLADALRWAFDVAPEVEGYRDAARLVHERYGRMFEGHAINNALYVTFGILLGGRDFTKVVGETVAMGFDNDCTGATAASITGAVIGESNVPAHWREPFRNRMQNYLVDEPELIDVDELADRFRAQAERLTAIGEAVA